MDTQFDISEQCCNITKKKPFKDYAKRLEECHILGQRKMKVLDANTSMLIQVAMYMMEKQLRASRLVLGQGRMCLDT